MGKVTKRTAGGKAKRGRFLGYANGLLTVTVVGGDGKMTRSAYRVREVGSPVGRGFVVRDARGVEHETHVGGSGYRSCDCGDFQDGGACVHSDALAMLLELRLIPKGVPGCVGA